MPKHDIRPLRILHPNTYRIPYLERQAFYQMWLANVVPVIIQHIEEAKGREYAEKWLTHTMPGWFMCRPKEGEGEMWWFAHPYNGTLEPGDENYNYTLPELCGGNWAWVERLRSGEWRYGIRLGSMPEVRMYGIVGLEPSRDAAMKTSLTRLSEAMAHFLDRVDPIPDNRPTVAGDSERDVRTG